MQDIKKSAINEAVHANSFGKVSEFIYSMTPSNKRIQLLIKLTYFDREGKWIHVMHELIS